MNHSWPPLPLCLVLAMIFPTAVATATVVEYQNKVAWQSAAGMFTTLTFAGFPVNTNITTQYSALGITFTDGQDLILPGFNIFPNDGWGLNGAFDSTAVSFSQPMTSIGVDFPGTVAFKLFQQGTQIYDSGMFGLPQVGNFAGLISDVPFDRALIYDPLQGLFIDDLHFGPPIPEPGVLALVATAGLAGFGRRRREHA